MALVVHHTASGDIPALPGYYERDWSQAIPRLPRLPESFTHLAGLALPFIGMLYQPTGRWISYATSALNIFASVMEQKPPKEKTWNIIRDGAGLIGAVAELKICLVMHTAMDLAETLYRFRAFKHMTWTQVGENTFHVVSNALYLASFYSFSRKISYAIMGASCAVQGCWNVYRAVLSNNKFQKLDVYTLDGLVYGYLAGLYFAKGYLCYERFMKIHRVVQQVFVLMCSEIKHNEVPSWQSDRSRKLAQGCAYHLNQIRKRYDKDGIVVITSTDQHHLEIGKIIAEKLGQGPAQVQTDSMMHDRIKTGWELIEDKEQRQRDPGYIAFHSLSAQNQWCDMPDPTHPNSESHAMVAERLGQALQSRYAKIPNKQLPVFVLGSRIIQDYVNYLQLWTAHALPQATKNFYDGDITIIRTVVDENENTKFEIERLPRAQFRAPRRS